jgi:WD40 repeat protein/serine/threonine protein kinase
MNPRDVVTGDDEQFTLLLARYSDALTAGRGLDPADDTTLSAELRQRLQRALGCLLRLRQFRPRLPASDAITKVMEEGITLHDGIVGGQVGRFRILRKLGHGGGGIVFLAYDPDLRREVAVKVPHLADLLTTDVRRRFLREARAAASLDHPNLVPVHEAGESGGVCFLVSAYCPGGNLAQWLAARTTPVPVRQAAQILAELADAVQYVHAHGIYHRDIKPGNILLDPRSVSSSPPTPLPSGERGADCSPLSPLGRGVGGEGETAGKLFVPRLTDFGLAKLREAQTEPTHSGAVLGTVSYMAPEQVEGRVRDIGPATDVYGLGAVLYEMLTGRPPFRGASDADTLHQVLTDEPASPRRLRRDVPADLETICLNCLEKEPSRRYATAAELAADLRRFLAHEPIQARPLGRIERLRKWIRNRPALTVFFLSGLLVALVFLIASHRLSSLQHEQDTHRQATAQQEQERQNALRHKEKSLRQLHYAEGIAQAWHLWKERRLEGFTQLLEQTRLVTGSNDADDPRGFAWYYLSRLARSGPRVLRYPASMFSLAFSPDGTTCATGHHDGAIILWDTLGSRQKMVLKEHTRTVFSLAFSPDGTLLVSGSGSNHPDKPQGELLFWDTRKHQVIDRFPSPEGRFIALAFSSDGRTLAAALQRQTKPNELHLWTIPHGNLQLAKHSAVANDPASVAFLCDNRRVFVGHSNGTTSLCDAASGQVLEIGPRHDSCVLSAACGRQDAVVLTGEMNGRVRLRSLQPGGAWLGEYRHESAVWSVALSPDDRTVASISQRTLKVWDRTTRREHFSRPLAVTGRVVAFSPDGKALAFGGEDGRLWIHDLSWTADGSLSLDEASHAAATHSWLGHHIVWHPCEAWAVAFSPDSKVLASAGDDRAVRLWDPISGRELATLHGHRSMVSCIAFSPDGRLLASGSFDPQDNLKLWNPATGAEVATLPGHGNAVYALAFAPNGQMLASAGRDRSTRLWDVANGTSQVILTGHTIESLAFSPDGRTLALASESQALFLWDLAEKQLRRLEPPHPSRHVAVAFSPDGKTLATGDSEGTVRFFAADTGHWRLSVRRHSDAINCLAFSPDGKTLATASFDKNVKLWQTTTGRELLTLPEQKDRVRWLAFSPDGTMLATACHDGILKIYRADRREEAQLAK